MDKRGSVLIVEDDADVRRAARVALRWDVEQVECVGSTPELQTILETRELDAVLLDMNFTGGQRGGQEGLDALAQVGERDPTLSVVVMTAYGGVSLAVEAVKRGALDFILKPWHNDKLVSAVLAAVDQTRARRAVPLNLEAIERDAIEKALARCNGNISTAAAELGLSRAALYRRLSKHGL